MKTRLILAGAGLLVAGALLGGCAPSYQQTIAEARRAPSKDPSLPYACNRDPYDAQRCAQALAERRDPWPVGCSTDPVTAVRTCTMRRLGRPMNSDGSSGDRAYIPMIVSFLEVSGPTTTLRLGPFIKAGFHTFPGRYPTIRVDDHVPIMLKDDGGVSLPVPEPAAVEEMRRGKVLRVQYVTWPDGVGHNAVYDLAGFEAAWQRLLEMKDAR